MARIFITGGAGFIGSNFVRLALANGDEVTVLDALTYAGNLSTLRDVEAHPGFRFIKGDICDVDAVQKAIVGHDSVVHFAAESHVDRSISGPHDFVTTNCLGTSVVMKAALDAQIQRVVHISTDETYGSIETGVFHADDKLTPRSPYSASKAGSDLIALSYFTTYELPVLVVRSSNNFGPFQYPEKVIPLFVTNLLENKKVPLYGDGKNIRDWCYVADNCSAIDAILKSGTPGEIYNVGAHNHLTNVELTKRILQLLGKDDSFIQPVEDRLGHDFRYAIDTSNTEALGWKPQFEFDDALRQTVTWYQENRWWWEPLRGS